MTKLNTSNDKPRDTRGRRSRFARTPTGKRIVLGKRDLDILRWLYRYRYLRQSHLQVLLQPRSAKRFVERLGDLYHETGLINRPGVSSGSFDIRATPMLYEISPSGIEWLIDQNSLPHRTVTFSFQSRRSYRPQLPHTMMIIETLLDIECATMAREGERFVPVDEVLGRAPESTRNAPNPLAVPSELIGAIKHANKRKHQRTWLIPDALYGIEYDIRGEKRYRFWALECERTSPAWRSTNSTSSTALKRIAYDALITSRAHRAHWGIPNLKLNIVRAPSRDAIF
jgi:hypothetical protein